MVAPFPWHVGSGTGSNEIGKKIRPEFGQFMGGNAIFELGNSHALSGLRGENLLGGGIIENCVNFNR